MKHEGGSSSGSSSGGGDSGDDGSSSGGSYDGTTGKACASDTDCHPPGGPGVNKCTSGGIFGSAGGNDLYPTAVCLDIQNCDPGTDGNLHFCDGPDAPTSPGVCLSTGSPGKGICLPQCSFKPDGSAVTGCQGKDSCFVAGFEADPNNANAAIGIGYCFGGCTADADCATGQKCQTDSGLCLKTLDDRPGRGHGLQPELDAGADLQLPREHDDGPRLLLAVLQDGRHGLPERPESATRSSRSR